MSIPNHHSLLLLPPPPPPPSEPAKPAAFRAAYYPPLKAALAVLASLKLPTVTILELALPIASAITHVDVLENFYEIEDLLSTIYTLVCVICEKEAIETEGPGGVDVRVVLLSNDAVHNKDVSVNTSVAHGPVIDFPTLAITRRTWRYIFVVDGEVGHDYADRYLSLARRLSPPLEGNIQKVRGGLVVVSSSTSGKIPMAPSARSTRMRHSAVAVGGTFDHLHAGHKLLLTATAMLLQHDVGTDVGDRAESKRLVVGITGDELLKNKKYREYLASWEERARDVTEFLKSILFFVRLGHEEEQTSTQLVGSSELGPNATRSINTMLKPSRTTIECVEIQDPFGPTITDETITGLAVSGETRSGGKAINDKRVERGWQPLEVFEIAVLDAEEMQEDAESSAAKKDFASKISSSEIRKRKAERAKLVAGPVL